MIEYAINNGSVFPLGLNDVNSFISAVYNRQIIYEEQK